MSEEDLDAIAQARDMINAQPIPDDIGLNPRPVSEEGPMATVREYALPELAISDSRIMLRENTIPRSTPPPESSEPTA